MHTLTELFSKYSLPSEARATLRLKADTWALRVLDGARSALTTRVLADGSRVQWFPYKDWLSIQEHIEKTHGALFICVAEALLEVSGSIDNVREALMDAGGTVVRTAVELWQEATGGHILEDPFQDLQKQNQLFNGALVPTSLLQDRVVRAVEASRRQFDLQYIRKLRASVSTDAAHVEQAAPQAQEDFVDDGRERAMLLDRKYAVTRATAALVLEVTDRQIRNLISDGHLDEVGEGHNKKVTTASVRARLGIPEQTGNSRK